MDIAEIKKKLTSLSGEQRQGAIDAVKAILKGRSSQSNNQQPQTGKDLKIDPDLLVPTSGNNQPKQNETDFDDPDGLLKKRKFHGDQNNKQNSSSENNSDQDSNENNEYDETDETNTDSTSNSSNNSTSNSSDSKNSDETSEEQNSSANKSPSRKTNQSSDNKEQHQPQIGDTGDPESDLRKAEDAYRKANEYKDEAEQKADQAEAEGDFDEANKQQKLADKASELADKARDLADGDELSSKEQARLKRIQDALHDINIERKIQDETENAVLNDREVQKRKKEAQKNSKGLKTRSGGLNAFKASIDKFMRDELAYKRVPSWKRPNKRYPAETGIVLRGKARAETKNIPLLVVYFDQSGSWSRDDVQKGLAAIESLNYYVKQHKLKLEIYYFAVNIHMDAAAARAEGGTLDAITLVEDIKKRKPNNVVIMTDSDPDSGGYCPSVTVDGGVWLLFRNNDVSRQLYRNVNGKKLKEVFSI